MTILALIRVSDSAKQTADGQRDRIERYATENRMAIGRWIDLAVSGSKTTAEDRGWYTMLESLSPGDDLITADVARISRDQDAGEIIYAIQTVLRQDVSLHFAITGQVLSKGDLGDAAKLFTTVAESYVASRFSKERSEKAKAAARRRQLQGLHAGRPKGLLVRSVLDEKENFILRALTDKQSKASLARELGVSRSALIKWLALRENIRKQAIKQYRTHPSTSIIGLKRLLNKQLDDGSFNTKQS